MMLGDLTDRWPELTPVFRAAGGEWGRDPESGTYVPDHRLTHLLSAGTRRSPPRETAPMPLVMSMNVQAAGAPARVTLKDYELASTAVPAKAPDAPPAKLDQFTPADRKAAVGNSYADALRVAALRRDAAAPGVAASDRAKTSTDDTVIAKRTD
jgi:hypothetical protein